MGLFDKLSGRSRKAAGEFVLPDGSCLDQADRPHALPDLTDAIRLDASDAQVRWRRSGILGTSDDSARFLDELAEELKADSALGRAHLSRGDIYADLGKFDGAIADLTEAIMRDPSSAVAFYVRGSFQFLSGDYGKTIADCTEAIRLDPNLASAYVNRSATNNEADRSDLALADCSEAMRLNANDPRAHYNRGWACARKGDHRSALAEFAEAMRLGINDPGTHLAWMLAAAAEPVGKPHRDMCRLLNNAIRLAALLLERPGKIPHVTPMTEGFAPFAVGMPPRGQLVYFVIQPQRGRAAPSWSVLTMAPDAFVADGPGTYPAGDYVSPPIDAITHSVKRPAATGSRATAAVDRVRFRPPDQNEAKFAIRVELQHTQAKPLICCLPYELNASGLRFGRLWAARG
jgi:tetratricopeptide (TPR) repeat protein